MEYELDNIDKKILDIIQTNFPLDSNPYHIIGEQVGISAKEALDKVINLKKVGIIRRLGANFQSKKLGFRSTLCAAKVPQEKMELFVKEVNAKKGVTHNYLRDHTYNIWFTLIGPSWESVCKTLDDITAKTGIAILNLPAKKMYKIKVNFAMEEE